MREVSMDYLEEAFHYFSQDYFNRKHAFYRNLQAGLNNLVECISRSPDAKPGRDLSDKVIDQVKERIEGVESSIAQAFIELKSELIEHQYNTSSKLYEYLSYDRIMHSGIEDVYVDFSDYGRISIREALRLIYQDMTGESGYSLADPGSFLQPYIPNIMKGDDAFHAISEVLNRYDPNAYAQAVVEAAIQEMRSDSYQNFEGFSIEILKRLTVFDRVPDLPIEERVSLLKKVMEVNAAKQKALSRSDPIASPSVGTLTEHMPMATVLPDLFDSERDKATFRAVVINAKVSYIDLLPLVFSQCFSNMDVEMKQECFRSLLNWVDRSNSIHALTMVSKGFKSTLSAIYEDQSKNFETLLFDAKSVFYMLFFKVKQHKYDIYVNSLMDAIAELPSNIQPRLHELNNDSKEEFYDLIELLEELFNYINDECVDRVDLKPILDLDLYARRAIAESEDRYNTADEKMLFGKSIDDAKVIIKSRLGNQAAALERIMPTCKDDLGILGNDRLRLNHILTNMNHLLAKCDDEMTGSFVTINGASLLYLNYVIKNAPSLFGQELNVVDHLDSITAVLSKEMPDRMVLNKQFCMKTAWLLADVLHEKNEFDSVDEYIVSYYARSSLLKQFNPNEDTVNTLQFYLNIGRVEVDDIVAQCIAMNDSITDAGAKYLIESTLIDQLAERLDMDRSLLPSSKRNLQFYVNSDEIDAMTVADMFEALNVPEIGKYLTSSRLIKPFVRKARQHIEAKLLASHASDRGRDVDPDDYQIL